MTNDDNAMNHDAWFAGLCAQAEELRQELADATDEDAFDRIKSIIDRSELVIGIWPDASTKDGYGSQIIKGAHILQNIISEKKSDSLVVAAIPCICYEQAIAASQVMGDMSGKGSSAFH